MWKPSTSQLAIAHGFCYGLSASLFSTLSAQGCIAVKGRITLYMNIGYEYPKPPSAGAHCYPFSIWMIVISCVARLLE